MNKKKYRDLFLPDQDFARYLYADSEPYEEALYQLVNSYASNFSESDFALTTSPKVEFEEMSSPPFLLAFLNTIIKLIGAKTVLEIGTFIGHSTLQFARMVGETGHVTTLEVFKDFADIARKNFAQNAYANRITLIEGDAGKALEKLPAGGFDIVFIDGNKQTYLDYTLRAEELISAKGVIIVDDVFFHGDALNQAPTTEKGVGCKALIDHYRNDDHFEKLLLPIRNGILLLFKRSETTKK